MYSNKLGALVLAFSLAACGGSEGGGVIGPGDDVCGFGSARLLPFEAGLTWSYQVTNVQTGQRKTKAQSLAAGTDPTFGAVIVQTTGKLAGSTRSLLRLEGDRVVRLKQEDITDTGAVDRTTTYDPSQLRLDETPARLVTGATWDEAYVENSTDALGVMTTVPNTDSWLVVNAAAPCESPLGTFSCVQLRRTRTAGGVAVKEFFFARGIGKIRETGDSQVEVLVSCGQ